MTFDELSTAMINHFVSRATQWRIRQSLSQLRQLEKESVVDYSHSVRTHCARLSLPRSETTRSEDKTLDFNSQQNDFSESMEMR